MPHANELHDDDRYEFVPPMISPISDSPDNPDSACVYETRPGTVKTVTKKAKGGSDGEAY